MQRLILTPYPVKRHPTIEQKHLLEKRQKLSLPDLRKAWEKLGIEDTLILVTDPKLAKVFKPDYRTNDHGIYYECGPNVIVFLEQETQQRDYERFLTYDQFVDPVFDYSVTNDLEGYFSKYGDPFILDIETTGLDFTKHEITMLSVKAIAATEILIIDYPSIKQLKTLWDKLTGKEVVGHNLLFDLSWILYHSQVNLLPSLYAIDTMLLAHVAGERRLSLKHLSMMYGNFLGRRNTTTADHNYLIEDMLTTELLYNQFKDKYDTFAGRLVCEAVKVFTESKVYGVNIDEKVLFRLRDEYKYLELDNKYDFNVNSNRELAEYFISKGVPLSELTDRGDYKVDQKTLSDIKHHETQKYLDYKQELSIYQKYILPYSLLEDFTIRPDIKLWGTETGRLSCSNPNVQQIPNRSKFKDIFRSRFEGGYIGTIDLDRAELGVAALLSGDEEYAKALTSQDFHSLVAQKTFEKDEVTKKERFTAKAVNFGGVLYGGSAKGIASRIGVEPEIVEQIQRWYKKAFPVLTQWIEDQKTLSIQTYQVETFFGRLRYMTGYRPDQVRRIGVNTAVQSVANDIMLYITTRLAGLIKQRGLRSKVLFPVHDELLLDIHPEEVDRVVELLKIAFKDVLKTPLGKLPLTKTLAISGTLEVGDSWLYLKSEEYKPVWKTYISSLGDV